MRIQRGEQMRARRIVMTGMAALFVSACAAAPGTGRWIAAASPQATPPATARPDNRRYDPARDAAADLRNGLATAAASGRRVLVIFGAEWCRACHALESALADPPVADLLHAGYVTVLVDVGHFDRNMPLAKRYVSLHRIPSVAILDGAGTALTTTDREPMSGYTAFQVLGYLTRWAPDGAIAGRPDTARPEVPGTIPA
jgi:thioredoxin 1